MKRLTDPMIQAAMSAPIAKRVDLADGSVPGLMIRLGSRRAATWSLQLRVSGEGGVSSRGHVKKGRRYRLTLGSYPSLSIQAARSLANAYIDQAQRGVNPAHALAKAATVGGLTIAALSERFLDDYIRMKGLRSRLKCEGAIRVHIVPALGTTLAEVLSRERVRALIRQVMNPTARGSGPRARARGGIEAARTVLGVLRRMMNWAMREELLVRTTNPATGMEDNLPRKRQKDRVLALDEVRLAWNAADLLGYPFGPVYRLLMLTGCRPGEWGKALRSWVDLNQSLTVIPADSYKSGHVHVIPLVQAAVDILRPVLTEHRGRKGDFIFSGTEGERPLAGWNKAQARMLRACCAITGERTMKPWTPHDLRRTVATRIAEQLGAGHEQLVRRMLGHSDGSVTAIYNRYGYVKEMRAALERWAQQLTAGSEEASDCAVHGAKVLDGSIATLPIHPRGLELAS